MRDTFISILVVLAIAASSRCSDIGKDGFNFYKDYLRARSDEGMPDEPLADRMLYFYRTPLQLYPSLIPALEQEYKKRTANAFKNHMLSKELWAEGERSHKRSSKTALSYMLQLKHPYHIDETAGNDADFVE